MYRDAECVYRHLFIQSLRYDLGFGSVYGDKDLVSDKLIPIYVFRLLNIKNNGKIDRKTDMKHARNTFLTTDEGSTAETQV